MVFFAAYWWKAESSWLIFQNWKSEFSTESINFFSYSSNASIFGSKKLQLF